MSGDFDVVVIGAGPGGYVAAIRAAQLGQRTACIDAFTAKDGKPALGGTCLNVGCIPSKALLQSSEHFHALTHDFADHGVIVGECRFDAAKMIARKDNIVKKLTSGIGMLFKKNKIESLHGTARLVERKSDLWQVEVKEAGGATRALTAKHVIVATGSRPRDLPGLAIDNINVLDNEGALAMTAVPKRLGVIGAGVIGLEMGSVWKRLGSEVTVLEALPTFLAAADRQIADEAFKTLTKDTGLKIELGIAIGTIKTGKEIVVPYEKDGVKASLTVDKLIVSIGRVPNTDGLGAKENGLALDERGFIAVDGECRTNLPNVWAIGDVVRGPMLAHKASEEGVAVAERIAGQKPHVDFATIPFVVYTAPEIAWVGKTEEMLKAEGIAYKKGVSTFFANGRALGMGQPKGTVKILADAATDRVLGLHMIGPMVSELVTEGVLAMEFKAASEDIARIVHAHPSLSEVVHEAALAADKRALHG